MKGDEGTPARKLFSFREFFTFAKRKMPEMWANIMDAVRGAKLRSNVMNSLVWLSLPIALPAFYGIIWGPDLYTKGGCLFIVVLYLQFVFRKYSFWAIKDPDRLHSESFYSNRLRMEMMMGKKGESAQLGPSKDPVQPKDLLK